MEVIMSKTIYYDLEFFSDWHCGSGLASGAEADAVVIKDRNGLPYVPGKTLKGLIKEAYMQLYGTSFPEGLFFSDAELSENLKSGILKDSLTEYMYHNVSSIAMKDGVTVKGSLRTIQVTVPCRLSAVIRNVPDDKDDGLLKAMKYVKRLGYGRHRGYGRCCMTERFIADQLPVQTGVCAPDVDRLYFKCRLLSDVIISQTSATSGPQSTLDFIPGSCFWGIVANEMYSNGDKGIYEILYSGNCRFGDAHPSYGRIRSLRTPASFYYKKDTEVFTENGADSEVYVSHAVETWPAGMQPKQCRGGFVAVDMDQRVVSKVDVTSSMAIKTAWDSATRSAQKSQLFTYESLGKGLEMLFRVDVNGNQRQNNADTILKYLTGIKRVGRSRSAQYGLVEISQVSQEECLSVESAAAHGDYTTVYADSRLIFLDSFGMPHFQPSAEELGFPAGAKVIWEKSQVRTFSYSSYNAHRGTHNSDYAGIEKGSVFVVEGSPAGGEWVGAFNAEGFGHVIYDPAFFEAGEGGVCAFRFCRPGVSSFPAESDSGDSCKEPLLDWLKSVRKESEVMSEIFLMNNNIGNWFNAAVSASQWGQIRQIAMVSDSYDVLCESVVKFIENGLRSDYWRGVPGKSLKEYLAELKEILEANGVSVDRFAPMAVVNLASLKIAESRKGKKSQSKR